MTTKIKICGPLVGSYSPMSCERHAYKAVKINQPKSVYTKGDCKVYDMAGSSIERFMASEVVEDC